MSKAASVSCVSMRSEKAYPTIFLSFTIAKYSQPSPVGMQVMPPTQAWSGCSKVRFRMSKFAAMGWLWLEFVIALQAHHLNA